MDSTRPRAGDPQRRRRCSPADKLAHLAAYEHACSTNDGGGPALVTAALVGTVFQNEDYGIAFHNGSELRKQADAALLKMREDGDYDLIKQKWFGPQA